MTLIDVQIMVTPDKALKSGLVESLQIY